MSVLTRIKNNQITDSTIFANNKVAAGSIVGSLFASNLTMTSDVLITGNLQVQGSTSYSTLATTNTYINDPLIVLNNGATGTNSKDIGLVFELGDDTNQMMIWDESASQFALASTSETGDTAGSTTISAYADMRVKDITAGDVAVNGGDLTTDQTTFNLVNATATTLNLAGAASTINMGAAGGTMTVANDVLDLDGDLKVDGGDITTAATTFNLVNTTATTLNIGGAASALNLGAATGNVTVADGLVVTDNLWGVDAYFTDINTTAGDVNFSTSGTVTIDSGTTGTIDGVNIGGSTAGTGAFTTLSSSGTTSLNLTSAVALNNTPIGNATPSTGKFTTLTSTDLTAGRVPYVGASDEFTDEAAFAYDAVNDTLKVGDVSVDGANATIKTTGTNQDLVLAPSGSGAIDANGTVVTNLADPTSASDAVTLSYLESAISSDVTTIQQDDSYVQVSDDGVDPGWIDLTVDGTEVANLQVGTASIFADSLKVSDGSNVAVLNSATFYVGSTSEFDGAVSVDATTTSTSSTTGALKVAGGLGVAENLNVGGTLDVTGATNLNNTTQSTNATTGALIVDGGVGVAKNLNVGGDAVVTGNLTVNGTLTNVNSTDLTVTDKNIVIANGAADSASADGAGITVDGADATLTYVHATTSWDLNKVTKVTNATDSTSPTTGSLLTAGGLGVAKDLFVGGGDIGTDQTTFNLINTTATTLNIGGAATTLELGAASGTTSVNNNLDVDGDVNVDGGDLTTNQTTFNLVNTTATTLNVGGAASALNLGAGTGNVTVADGLVITDNTWGVDAYFTDVTASADMNTVTLTTTGTTSLNLTTAVALNNTPIGNVTPNTGAFTTLSTTGEATLASAIVQDLTATRVTYAGGSGALVDSANMTFDGTDLTVASAKVSDLTSGRIVTAGTDGALQDDANLTWDGSDVSVTGGVKVSDLTSGRVTYATTSGQLTDSANMTFDGTDLTVASAKVTDLTSGRVTYAGASGALTDEAGFEYNAGTDTLSVVNVDATQVDAGNLTISGDNITGSNGEVVVNNAQADVNFRVESDTNTHMLFVDAGAETVIVGGSTATTDAAFKVESVKSMMMPVGTTSDRPASGVAGMLRFNSTVTALEFYDGSDWQNAQGSFTVIASETFSGDDSTVAFTLADAQTTASCIVSINGVVQLPTTAYSVSSTTLTFTEAPATGDTIEVRKLTTTTTVAQLADGNSKIDVSASDGVDIVVAQTGVTVGTSATTVDSFATSLYRSAKYVLQGQNAAGDEWEIAEALVVHDGTTATLTVYGVTATGADSWTYSATISGGNVLLQATAGEASTTVKFQPTYIRA